MINIDTVQTLLIKNKPYKHFKGQLIATIFKYRQILRSLLNKNLL